MERTDTKSPDAMLLQSWIIACKENHLNNTMNTMLLLFECTNTLNTEYDEVILNSITTNKAFYVLTSRACCVSVSDVECL